MHILSFSSVTVQRYLRLVTGLSRLNAFPECVEGEDYVLSFYPTSSQLLLSQQLLLDLTIF